MVGERYTMHVPKIGEVDAFGMALSQWDANDRLGTGLRAGDYGWMRRNGDAWMQEQTRIWVDEAGTIVAGGLREGEGLWVQIDPAHLCDVQLAEAMVDQIIEAGFEDVSGPAAPSALRAALAGRGGAVGPDLLPHLWRPLTDADLVEVPGVVTTTTDDLVAKRIAVQRAAFEGSTFTREKWDAMAATRLFRPELDLIALNERDQGVSALTAWLSGPGACGVVEPMGTHRDHWRQGHGLRVLRGCFAALRREGAASVRVFTAPGNEAALAAYQRAGFRLVGRDTTMRLPS